MVVYLYRPVLKQINGANDWIIESYNSKLGKKVVLVTAILFFDLIAKWESILGT